jgi:hypothetical protein
MRNWENFFESIVIPGIKVDEFIIDIEKSNDSYKTILANYYNTFENYIDIVDNEKHIFKINDLTCDILNNNRVSFSVMVFEDNQLDGKIKENITLLSMQEFYSNIPNMINIYGIDIKPISFINKEDLEYTFNEAITKQETIRIITQSSGYKYDGEKDGYYIWSKK